MWRLLMAVSPRLTFWILRVFWRANEIQALPLLIDLEEPIDKALEEYGDPEKKHPHKAVGQATTYTFVDYFQISPYDYLKMIFNR